MFPSSRRAPWNRPPLPGHPPIANRMLRRVRDFAQVKGDGTITRNGGPRPSGSGDRLSGPGPGGPPDAPGHHRKYGGGPVGLDTLAATIGEESVTLEDVYEPYLMQLGFLDPDPRGRCVTRKAYEHLHMDFMGQEQLEL